VPVAKILIAPDSFKGSATSAQVAKALADGWKISRPNDEIVIAPFADGGEGTLDCIESVTPGSVRIPITVQGATGIEHQSSWLLVGSDTAVIEMATLCGITTVAQLDPLGAHSYGLGQAINLRQAIDMFTINAARRLGIAENAGSISVGKYADFIILDQNPFQIPVTELHKVQPFETWIAGEKVFERVKP